MKSRNITWLEIIYKENKMVFWTLNCTDFREFLYQVTDPNENQIKRTFLKVCASDPENAYLYALKEIEGRWLEGEESILRNHEVACNYLGEFLLNEWGLSYKEMFNDPWPEEDWEKHRLSLKEYYDARVTIMGTNFGWFGSLYNPNHSYRRVGKSYRRVCKRRRRDLSKHKRKLYRTKNE